MVVLSFSPGALDPFAFRLKSEDNLDALRARVAKKLNIQGPAENELQMKYAWVDVLYPLEDQEDWETFLERTNSVREVKLVLSGPPIPTPVSPPLPGHRPLSSLGSSTHGVSSADSLPPAFTAHDVMSTYSYSTSQRPEMPVQEPKKKKEHSIHLIATSSKGDSDGASTLRGGLGGTASIRSKRTTASKASLAHSIAFEEFQNSNGVRTFVGSIGPVENVRMMIKQGHRACYMSRQFAQQHNFIPKDAAPGYYGFSGITNLGSWPIKVGEKTVEQQVMLVENAYFPVVLGRSFMERRGVRFDPLEQTSVIFTDTGEHIPTDVVLVRDHNDEVVTVA